MIPEAAAGRSARGAVAASRPAEVAAAYLFYLCRNHPFIDGNKRTAMASALTFLEQNGVDVAIFDGERLYDAMIAIAEKRLDKAGLAAVFRAHLTR